MKHFIFYFSISLFFISCNGNSSQSVNNSDSIDSLAKEKISEPPQPTRDSISIEISKSSFNCTRSKTVKEVDKVVKLFGADVNVKMENASFSTDAVIKILSGSWFNIDKKFDGGKIVLDMASISTVQVGKNNELEMTSPEYLDVKNYPTAMLQIMNIDTLINVLGRTDKEGKPLTNKTDKISVLAYFTLKNTVRQISPKNIVCSYIENTNCPEKISFDFNVNGIEWGLNNKNSKVVKDDLLFHVVLITKK